MRLIPFKEVPVGASFGDRSGTSWQKVDDQNAEMESGDETRTGICEMFFPNDLVLVYEGQ